MYNNYIRIFTVNSIARHSKGDPRVHLDNKSALPRREEIGTSKAASKIIKPNSYNLSPTSLVLDS